MYGYHTLTRDSDNRDKHSMVVVNKFSLALGVCILLGTAVPSSTYPGMHSYAYTREEKS